MRRLNRDAIFALVWAAMEDNHTIRRLPHPQRLAHAIRLTDEIVSKHRSGEVTYVNQQVVSGLVSGYGIAGAFSKDAPSLEGDVYVSSSKGPVLVSEMETTHLVNSFAKCYRSGDQVELLPAMYKEIGGRMGFAQPATTARKGLPW